MVEESMGGRFCVTGGGLEETRVVSDAERELV